MLKKFLSAVLIGAFVFGISFNAAEVASAKTADKSIHTENKTDPPEPPKDANGKPLPPPDKSEHMLDGPGMVKKVD